MDSNDKRIVLPVALVLAGAATLAACAAETRDNEFRDIEAVCVDNDADARGEWTCPEPVTVECSEAPPAEIYVVRDGDDESCSDAGYEAIEGPFEPGTHAVTVVDRANDEAVCTAELRVVDETAPEVYTREIELWPPNHKMVEIPLVDCFEEVIDCDDDWTARVLWATSDEPADAKGDGHTDPDMHFIADDVIALRSERSGQGNGRVYTVGFEVEDASGNVTEGECAVLVPHDQGHRATNDGPDRLVDPSYEDEGDEDE